MQLSHSKTGIQLRGRIEEVTCPLLLALASQSSLTGDIILENSTIAYTSSFQDGNLVGLVKQDNLLAPNLLDMEERDRISLFVKEVAQIFAMQTGNFQMLYREHPQHLHLPPDRVPMPFLLRYGLARTPAQNLVRFLFQKVFPQPTTVKIQVDRTILQLMGGKVEEEIAPFKQGQIVIPSRTTESLQQVLLALWGLCLLEVDHVIPLIHAYYHALQVLRQPPIDALPLTFPPLWEQEETTPSADELMADLEEIVMEDPDFQTPTDSAAATEVKDEPILWQDVDLPISDELLQAINTEKAIEQLLTHTETWHASDLFLSEDKPPAVRVHGSVVGLELPPTRRSQFENFLQQVLTQEAQDRFANQGDLDMGYSLSQERRFRINLHHQQGRIGLVARAIPSGELSLTELGLPAVLRDLASLQRGLILVTGSTGSGKSTTLAAMIHHINRTRQAHIVTIEEPIEFIHSDIRSRITQREVGSDTTSFHAALRHVVRESPDVILIGEMRDMETMTVALSAALTGHLVLATLHTINTVQTLQRIMSYYPEHLRDRKSVV